jgi:hypothetical protein
MKKRLKRTTKQYIVVSLLSVFIIGGAFITIYFTVISNLKDKYLSQIKILSEKLDSQRVYTYEANKDIPAGSRITEEMVHYSETYSNQSQKYYMTKADIGMVTLIDISKGTQILKGMLTENNISQNIREVEYNSFLLNSNLEENNYVDIRIRFPNGEDYIVLSKKSLKNLSLENNNCFVWLTEEEILNMSGAIVDAYLYTGTKLYTTKYIEPSLQEASIVTYYPSEATLTLMEQDKNIVDRASQELNKKLRRELEMRLAEQTAEEVTDQEWQSEVNIQSAEESVNPENSELMEDYLSRDDLKTEEDSYKGRDTLEEEEVEYGG